MAKGDVDLVIRAKDEATKSLDAIAKALAALEKTQTATGASAGKSGNLLDQFAKTVGVVAAAYDRLQSGTDKAAASFDKQKSALDEQKAAYASLTTQLEAAQRVQERMASFVGPLPKGGQAQMQLVARAVQDLTRQSDRLSRSIGVQQENLTKSFYALEEVAGGSTQAAAALAKVQQAHQQAAAAAEADAAAQARAAQALQQAALAGQRRSGLETRRDLTSARSSARAGQQAAQAGIAGIMAAGGPQTDDQAAQMERLKVSAGAYKQAVNTLSLAIEQYSRVLRDNSVTQEQAIAAQARAEASLADVAKLTRQAAVAADEGAAAQARQAAALAQTAQAAQAAQAVQRRSALETRRDLTNALGAAQANQQASQGGIKAMAVAGGPKDDAQIAQMAQLKASAGAYKQAVNELAVAIEQYNRVLRDNAATQEQVAAAQSRARATLASVATITRQQAAATGAATAAQRGKTAASEEEAGAASKLDASLQSLFSNSRRSLSLYQRWRGELLSLTSTYFGLIAAIEGFNRILRANISIQSTSSRLNVVTGGDPQKTAQEMQYVIQQADRLGFSMDMLGAEWSKFAVAAQNSNFSLAEARKIFESVATAGRVMNLTTENMQDSFLALTQMMSKGTIQMQELRQQLGDHLPGAFVLMSKAAGVSASELSKMMQKGQLTSDFLLKFADVLNDTFGGQLPQALKNVNAEIGRFQTRMTIALNEIGDAGTIQAFSDALRKLQTLLKSDDAHVWFQRIGSAIGGIIKFLMAVVENLDLIGSAFVALGTVKGVAYVMSLIKAIQMMVLEVRTARTAMVGLNTVMAGLGGPIGIALGVLAGAFAFLATRVSESDKAMQAAKHTTDDLVASYQAGVQGTKGLADVSTQMGNLQIERTRGALQDRLKRQLIDLGSNLSTTIYDGVNSFTIPAASNVKPLQDLVDAVKRGDVPLSEFKKRLDDIAKADPSLKKLALNLQDQADGAIKTDDAMRKFEASVRLIKGTATDADKSLLGLSAGIENSGEAAATAARHLERYKSAMESLGKAIPEMKKAIDRDTNLKAVQQALDAAIKAADGDQAKIQAAKDRALQATAALNQQYEKELISEFGDHGSSILQAVDLLKSFEGFTASAKWDVNAFRAGYGSDTITRPDGTTARVTADTTVTEVDALRDLVRRIGEYQDTIKNQVGSDKFNAFTASQQAALTSIAYNYGSLPKDIVNAIKYGTNETIAAAVRGHVTDNGGVNAGRRNREADILANDSPAFVALTQKIASTEDDRVKKVITDLAASLKEATVGARDKFIEQQVHNAQPTDPNAPRMTPEQEASVRQKAGETFDAQQTILVQQKIVQLQKELNKSKAGSNREDFIAAEAQKQRIDLTSAEGQKWAELEGKVWDRANAEKQVNDLMTLRQSLLDRFAEQQNAGDTSGAAATSKALDAVNKQLDEAIQKGIAFWQTMGADNPQAQKAIAALQTTQDKIGRTGKVTLDAKAINQDFTNDAVTGFNSVAESLAGWIDGTKTGKDVMNDLRNAFLKFASDFLRQIAEMILKQLIFNAISSMFGGGTTGQASGAGGLGGLIAGLFSHSGGTVGDGGVHRMVPSAVFAGALRYHSGGFPGLQPNEVPTILQKGEEVLARNNPRNLLNGGGGISAAPRVVQPKIVNVLDPSLVQDHLNSSAGESVLLNVIRRNGSAIKQILSGA